MDRDIMDNYLSCSVSTIADCKRLVNDLSEELERIQSLAIIGTWRLNLDTNIITCSSETYKIFELSPDTEVTYRTWFEYVEFDDRENLHLAFRETLSMTSEFDAEYRIVTEKGNLKWLRGRADFHSRKGNIVFGTVQDITTAKENEESLHRMSAVFLQSEEGSAITDISGNILNINAAFTRVTGYTPEDVIGKNPRVLQSGIQGPEFYQKMWNDILTLGVWSGEIWNKNKAGDIYPEHLKIFVVKDKKGKIINFISLFSDISEVKKHNDQLNFLAFHDSLTGLPNRSRLTEHIISSLDFSDRNNHLTVIAFLDLDGFKPVNDNFGHNIGDKLLIHVAETIQSNLRSTDTCARFGGDEFVILFTHVQDETEAHLALKRIIQQIHKPFEIDGNIIDVSASVGVTIYPIDNSNPDTLLRHADQAMYNAKQQGKNQIFYFVPSISSPKPMIENR